MAKMNKKLRKRLDWISVNTKIGLVRIDAVKRLRLAAGLTLTEAAKRAGMKNAVQWHDIESGKSKDPRVSTVCKIAAALNVDPADLLRKR